MDRKNSFGLTVSNIQKQTTAISSDLARIEAEEFEKAASEKTKLQEQDNKQMLEAFTDEELEDLEYNYHWQK